MISGAGEFWIRKRSRGGIDYGIPNAQFIITPPSIRNYCPKALAGSRALHSRQEDLAISSIFFREEIRVTRDHDRSRHCGESGCSIVYREYVYIEGVIGI